MDTPVEYFYGEMLRWSFGFENPNKAAVLFACIIPLLWQGWLAAFRVNSRPLKFIAIGMSGFVFIAAWFCLLMTFSRGGLVAAIAGMAIITGWNMLYDRQKGSRAIVWLSALLLLAVTGVAIFLGMGSRSIEAVGDDASVGNRLELWGAALQMAYENPAGFGQGRSGSEFMQWYQAVDRTEGYRTMVSSYLTFLVEQGWAAFVMIIFALATLWIWTWPDKTESNAGWSVALWGSLAAFLVSGIFSTTMEEPRLWILPSMAVILVVILKFKNGRYRLPLLRMIPGLGASAVLLIALFLFGLLQSRNDSLHRIFAKNAEDYRTVIGIQLNGTEPLGGFLVIQDEAVLGPDWGKLIRILALETKHTIHLSLNERALEQADEILLIGQGVEVISSLTSRKVILLAPAVTSQQSFSSTVGKLLLPEIDEDGRVGYWKDQVLTSGMEMPEIITLTGVGTRVEWAWEQVVEAMK